MLGLANTLSSGSVPESKYSLSFDGADDYLDLGLIDFDDNNFSCSFWFKVADGVTWTQYAALFDNRNTLNPDRGYQIRFTGTVGEVMLFSDFGGTTVSGVATGMAVDTWYHIAATVDRAGNQVLYVNGSDEYTEDISGQSSVDMTNALNLIIGKAGSTEVQAKIANLAIFKSALSAFNVYLLLGLGSDDIRSCLAADIKSNLVGYWRMGGGVFDDKVNGVVHDQVGNTGGDLVTGGGMGDASDWTAGTGFTVNDSSSGVAVHSNHGGGGYNSLSQDISAVNGKKYKVVWTISSYSGSGILWVSVGDSAATQQVSANGTYSHIVTCGSVDSLLRITAAATVDATIDNVSVFEVAPGFGGELLTNGTFETDTTGWSNLSGATFERNTSSPITGSGDIHWVGGGSSYTAFKHDAAISVVAGRTYRLEYTYKVVGSGEHVSAKLATSAAADGPLLSGFTETALTATSNTSVSYTFTSGATDDVYLVFRSGDGDSPEIYVDNVSLKQLNGNPGITSGGPIFSGDTP